MERSTEDRECIGGGLKRWSKEEGSANAMTNAAARASIEEVEPLVESSSNNDLVEPSSNDNLVKFSSYLESAVPSSEPRVVLNKLDFLISVTSRARCAINVAVCFAVKHATLFSIYNAYAPS